MCYDIRCGKEAADMTIKRRLFLSNVLMIVVPALVTALTGLLCMVMVVSVLRQGSGLGY